MPPLSKAHRRIAMFGHQLNLSLSPANATWIASLDDLLCPFITADTSDGRQADIIVRPLTAEANAPWLLFQDRQRTWITDTMSLVSQLEWRVFDASIRNAKSALAIHAGAVARGGIGVLLVGASSSGKTTLALALQQAGWLPLADDVCGLVAGANGVLVEPCQRCCHVSQESRALLAERGITLEGPVGGLIGYYRPLAWGQAAPVRRIIALRYQEGSPLERKSLSQAEGAALILSAAFAPAEHPRRAAWDVAVALTKQAPTEAWHYAALEDVFVALNALTREAC